MNLMLTASCNDADDFKINGYEKVKSEFSEWCDSSKCIFCKIDNQKYIRTFLLMLILRNLKNGWLNHPLNKCLKNIILFLQDILLSLYQYNLLTNEK